MQAAFIDRYGSPESISLVDVPRPVARAGEVLIRVAAAAVTSGDARLRSGRFPPGFAIPARLAIGLRGPRARIPGAVFSGTIVELGSGVSGLAIGDEVAGMAGMRLGAHAEVVAVKSTAVTAKPPAVSHTDAAAVLFGGSTALHFLRDRAKVGSGSRVLINGASGAVGTSAIQIATHLGAEVTAVSSRRNHELLQSLGAAHVIDYYETPLTEVPGPYDAVLDAVGNLSRSEGLRLTAPDGTAILAVASLADTIRARGRVAAGPAPERAEDFALLLDLVRSGALSSVASVVGDLTALPEAHRRIDSGRKVGNLVIVPR